MPKNLSRKLKVKVETIEKTQKELLLQSLKDSRPIMPDFLQEYLLELNKTANHLRESEKIPIYTD